LLSTLPCCFPFVEPTLQEVLELGFSFVFNLFD
jgi:hypothetical protein